MHIAHYNEFVNQLSLHLSHSLKQNLTFDVIQKALFVRLNETLDIDFEGNMDEINMSVADAADVLKDFDFDGFDHLILIEKEYIPDEHYYSTKVGFKSDGSRWIIHRYDMDPFPSNPHAHNLDLNYKLNLSNGDVWQRRNYRYTISKKKLLEIRQEASKFFKGSLPPLLV